MMVGDKIKCIKSYYDVFKEGKYYKIHSILPGKYVVVKSKNYNNWKEHFYLEKSSIFKMFSDYFKVDIKLDRNRKLLKLNEQNTYNITG